MSPEDGKTLSHANARFDFTTLLTAYERQSMVLTFRASLSGTFLQREGCRKPVLWVCMVLSVENWVSQIGHTVSDHVSVSPPRRFRARSSCSPTLHFLQARTGSVHPYVCIPRKSQCLRDIPRIIMPMTAWHSTHTPMSTWHSTNTLMSMWHSTHTPMSM